MINNIKKYSDLIILGISIIFLIGSLIFLLISSNTENSINNKDLKAELLKVKEYINENNLHVNLKNDGEINLNTLTLKKLLRIDASISPKGIHDCDQFDEDEDIDRCIYNYFFHTYSGFLNKKGVIDIQTCIDIESYFGKDGYLTERCYFIYAVNKGTKYLNINACDDLVDITNNKAYNKEQCIRNVKYSISGGDNTMGKYFKEIKERGEISDSKLGNQIINKYGNYYDGKLQGIELFKESIKDYLEKERELSNLENK